MPLPSKNSLKNALHEFVRITQQHKEKIDEESLSDLSLDPIPILLHCSLSGLKSKEDLLKIENWRRLDKAFGNAIGDFHEKILSSIEGWYKPETGFDLRNDDLKIIIEIKNKHNTMNSSSAKATYEKCLHFVQANPDWKVYLATIVPKSGSIHKPWVISGRKPNDKIQIIDGANLYRMVCGEIDALQQTYAQLPMILSEMGFPLSSEGETWFLSLYSKLYDDNCTLDNKSD